MLRVDKTVFLSYRRENWSYARLVFHDLTQHGYDVFIDYEGLSGGDFEQAILENLRARAHFLVILTPTTLHRCAEPKDWVRREIEEAIRLKRKIIPLMFDGFDFTSPGLARNLPDSLKTLPMFHGVTVVHQFFPAAMEQLRNYLSVPLDAVLHEASDTAVRVAKEQQEAAAVTPSPIVPKLGGARPAATSKPTTGIRLTLVSVSVAVSFIIFLNASSYRYVYEPVESRLGSSPVPIERAPEESPADTGRSQSTSQAQQQDAQPSPQTKQQDSQASPPVSQPAKQKPPSRASSGDPACENLRGQILRNLSLNEDATKLTETAQKLGCKLR